MATITQKSRFDAELDLIEESDDEDVAVPKAPSKNKAKPSKTLDVEACRTASKKLLAALEKEDDEPLKKRPRPLTSYQEIELQCFDEEYDDGETLDESLTQFSILRRRREDQARRVKEASDARKEITRTLRSTEYDQIRAWRTKKNHKGVFASSIDIAPTDPLVPRPKKSSFLITVTDNTQIVDASLDTCDLWVIPQFDDLIACYRSYIATHPVTSLIRPGNNIKTFAAAQHAVENNVQNVVFRMTRERSPTKGQAHLHMLATVRYMNNDGFYPQINTDTLRNHFKTFAKDNEKRFYINVTYIKDSGNDAKYYLTVPPGEKKEKKFSSKSYTPSVAV